MNQRAEHIFHQRKYIDGKKHRERCSMSFVIREMKLKPPWYTTPYLVECLKEKREKEREYHELARIQSNTNTFLEGMQNITTTLENSLAVSYGVKHTSPAQPSHSTSRFLLKSHEKVSTQKLTHTCSWQLYL